MKIAIIVTQGCQASSIHGIVDILLAAQYVLKQANSKQTLSFKLVGLKAKETSYSGFDMSPLTSIDKVAKPDLVIVPGAFESILTGAQISHRLARLRKWFGVLKTWQGQGAVMATACTGNFIIASSGIAQGRTLACHWNSEKVARKLFKDETFVAEKMLIDHGSLVSCGGAFAITQLVLYLIQRFFNRDICQATAKLMMIEPSFKVQSRFAAFSPPKDHRDKMVLRLQTEIEENLSHRISSKTLAQQWGISDRQLCRRFKDITGETPVSYLQRMRIEKSKALLELGQQRNNQIIWAVGYDDMSSFTRLFKRTTGMTMNEYRARFSIPVTIGL